MRRGASATAIILAAPMLAAGQDTPEDVTPPLGTEAYSILTSFYDYDRDIPLSARIVRNIELPYGTIEKVVFRSRDSHVTTFFALPKKGSSPFPCVLLLHGLGLDKMSWWEDNNDVYGGNLTKALLRSGVAVMCPDAPYHGERSHYNDYEFPVSLGFQKGKEYRFRDMMVQSIVDCRRAVDYLETRSDIDTSRIGVLGYSLGGIASFVLTALDKRIKGAVACSTPIGHLDRMGFHSSVLPRTFAPKLKDRSFLMLMGRQDESYTPAQANRVFQLIPSAEKKIVFYDSGHELPIGYVTKATEWLQKALE